jgi:hypothetical protein
MKIVQRYYIEFQGLCFAKKPRKQWPLSTKLYWWYLNVFVYLHQGIVHKNWQNVFADIGTGIQDQYKKYRQRRRMKRILRENTDIAELSKLSGIKNERKD